MKQAIQTFLLLHFLLCGWCLIGQDTLSQENYKPKLIPPIGHTGEVKSACFSPDGRFILTGGSPIKMWDLKTGIFIDEFFGTGGYVRYSPDGTHFVTAALHSSSDVVEVWDEHSGKLLHILKTENPSVNSVEYSPNGNNIVVGSGTSTTVWEANSGKLIHTLNGHKPWVQNAHYSPDGQYIVTAGADSTAKVWDANSGKLIHTLIGHTSPRVISGRYSPDGCLIVTTSWDSTARVWDAYSGELIHILTGHIAEVYKAQFSPDGLNIVTSSQDGMAKVWETSSGKLILTLSGHIRRLSFAIYSPNGRHILTGSADATAKLWDAKTGKLINTLLGHQRTVYSASYSPDERYIVTTGSTTAMIWDAATGKLVHDLKGRIAVAQDVQYSPDGNQVVIAYRDSTAKVWDVKSGKVLHTLAGHESYFVSSAEYSSDGKHIVTASWDGTARVWNANTGKLTNTYVGHSNAVSSAQFSPDGKRIVTAAYDSTAIVWDVETGKSIFTLTGHTKPVVNSASYSPDGRYIITGSNDRTAKVWDANTGTLIRTLPEHTWFVYCAQFSLDGKYIITGTAKGPTKLWDANSGALVKTLADSSMVLDAKFSPDGKHCVTTSILGTAKIWDSATGKLIHTLKGHTGGVNAVSYSPDGKFIATASWDGSVRFWHAETGAELISLYTFGNQDWVVSNPVGLYDATDKAMSLMYYLLNREVIELNQLKERYYEHELFKRTLFPDGRGFRDVKKLESLKLFPEAWAVIENDALQIHLKERNGGIGRLSLFINNKEVLADANPGRDTALVIDLKQFEKYYLANTLNHIGIRTWNEEGWLKSSLLALDYQAAFVLKKGQEGIQPIATTVNQQPRYYAVVVGTSDYSGELLDLRYADKDSKDMANALKQTAQMLFGEDKVQVEWFSTDIKSGSKTADKENIRAAFDSIASSARPEDVMVIYFSGHGVTYGGSENEQFYYLTKDIHSGELVDPAIRRNYAISTEELTQWINAIPARKQVMILDACSSGRVVDDLSTARDNNNPLSQTRALARMKDRTGMFVLSGSAADKASYEASQFGQGLLTYSLLLGMSGAALKDGVSVDVMKLFQFAREKVPEFARDIGGIQTPMLSPPPGGGSFDIGLVTDAVNIPLQEVKPVFVRSNFQEEVSYVDVLQLNKVMDEYLLDYSAETTARGIIFVDASKYRNAYSLNGRYTLEKEGQVLLRVSLIKGGSVKGTFEVLGSKDKLQEMTKEVFNKVSKMINM